MSEPTTEVVAAVWRIESARLTASLARRTGDFALAEDLAADTFAAALRQWPRDGVPDRPGAWLMATAAHRLADHARRRALGARKHTRYVAGTDDVHDPEEEAVAMIDSAVADDELRLLFMACHPALTRDSQVALTLKVIGGLSVPEIARAFLVGESTAAQRIVRAKRRLAEAGARFELPAESDVAERLATVLGVTYAIFNEGYSATTGDHWSRPELCADALRLGRRVVSLRPASAEAFGLLALMELQASRLPARQGPDGVPVLLEDQDRRRWDRRLVRLGLGHLERAGDLGGGPYTLQAEIAACHARSRSVETTDWVRIEALYVVLDHVAPSPVVKLNLAAATVRARGPEAARRRLASLTGPGLDRYPPYHLLLADIAERLGEASAAAGAYRAAAEVEDNTALRTHHLARAQELDPRRPRPSAPPE